MTVARNFAAILAASVAFGPRAAAQGAQPNLIPDQPTCPRCAIAVRTLAELGPDTGPGSLTGPPNAVRVDARGRYWVLTYPDPPRVFGDDGRFIRLAGGRGGGPGEFAGPVDATSLPGDSMLVLDGAGPRAMVFTPELVFARQIRLRWPFNSPVVLEWPAAVAFNGIVPTPEGAGWPIHVMSFSQADATLIASFGPDNGELRPGGEPALLQRLAPSRNGGFWGVDILRYRVASWTNRHTLAQLMERRPEWFATASAVGIGTPTSPPPPAVTGIEEDTSGLVWVFVRVAAPSWRDGWRRVARDAREVSAQQVSLEEMFRTTVEVIDPRAGRVIARRALDFWVTAALPNRRAAVYGVDPNGIPRIRIVQLELSGR